MVYLYLTSQQGLAGLHTMCIGLGMRLREEGLRVGYMKPLGHRYHQEEGTVTDEDAAFMRRTLELEEDLSDICPVLLTPKLVNEALKGEVVDMLSRVREALSRVERGKDLVLLQGAYTSLQGRMLGISAFELAPALRATVILVERFNDAYLADNALFARDRFGEALLGVIYNMVPANRDSFVRELLVPYLEKQGIPVLGVFPHERRLASINVADLARLLDGKMLCGEECGEVMVEDLVVGAMSQEHALSIFRKRRNYCVVTGGDRSDIQLAAMEAGASCLVLTGNLYPSSIILGKAEEMGIPVILVGTDTFTTAERAEMIIRSARTHEESKLRRLRELIDEHLDMERLHALAGIKPGGTAQ
ncbi:MAG: phosphotransacetylase family protein [Actinobacteria bacterium]|nr:phosphotransacetylase family protein [Actinomycetota bacterium]